MTLDKHSEAAFPARFLVNFYQDNVGSDLADTFPGDHIFRISSQEPAQFPGPGTMRASTVPVRQSISRSLTQPRERQVQILITSFRFRSHKRMTASGTGISFRLSYASERETVTDISIDSHPMIRYTLTKRVRFRRVSGGGSI